MTTKYDVLVLGAGNAGLAAARVTREHGCSVAIVDHRPIGGTCPLRGCVPKKVMVAAAEVLHEMSRAHVHHIDCGQPRVDWGRLIDRVQSFTEGVPESFAKSLEERGIERFDGRAKFVGPNEVEVDGERLEAGKIVIATGSKSRPLPFPGAEHLVTNEEILTERSQPRSIVFIGGGVIGMEFAHVYAHAGSEVTILEVAPRLLSGMDEDVVDKLHEQTERIGIEVLTEVEVQEIVENHGELQVRFRHNGETRHLAGDRVAHGAGRIPDVEDLDLDAAGIEHDGPKIALDNFLRSVSNPNVYAAGDTVAQSAQLSPLATVEGRIVGANIIEGNRHKPDYMPIPAVVYTVPSLAAVGLNEAQAREQGLAYDTKSTDMSGFLSARLYASEVAYAKVLSERDSGRILGAHLVGKRAEELIHYFALAMEHGLTRGDLASLTYAFPTFSSEVKSIV